MKRIYIALLTIYSIHAHTSITPDKLHQNWAGAYMEHKGELQQALQWYKKLIAEPETPGFMYKGMLHLLGQTQTYGPIIRLMPKVENAFKDDVEVQLLFAQALEKGGYQTAADDRIIKLFDANKQNPEVALLAAQTYLRRKELDNATHVINQHLSNAPGNIQNFVFYFLLAQIDVTRNKASEAIAHLQKSLDLNPQFDKGWLLYAILNEQAHDVPKSIEGYATYLETTTIPDPHLAKHLLQLALKEHGLVHQTDGNAPGIQQILALFEEHKYKKAISLLQKTDNK